ncbi:IS6 family transposase [Lactococcus lactis subsp. lactis]|nr:IS6 family transposase [Lactococcus lactis subsp. lactis]
MDEIYIKIKRKSHYLYRVIDAQGMTLDIWLRRKQDSKSAYAFLKRLLKQFREPRFIVTEKASSKQSLNNCKSRGNMPKQSTVRSSILMT